MTTQHQRLVEHVDVDHVQPTTGQTFIYNSAARRWEFVVPDQNIDGGKADSVYTPPQLVDGGNA